MRMLAIGAWLATGALLVLPAAPLPAQEPGAQELIDRVRQIQAEELGSQPPEPPAPAVAQPDLGEDEIRAIVQESLGVEILRVEVVEHDGAPAYAITVMNPGGNRNDALRVSTLLFDGASGSLLGQRSAAPRADAPHLPTAATPEGFESGGLEIRRRTWR